MSLPPGKRGREGEASVDLSGALKVIRRPLIRLVCSHVKNWGENSVRALSFVRNPLSGIMKGSWLPA
jgi:hypothetical protein